MIKNFPEQKKGEKSILILRRYWVVFFNSIILFFLAALGPIVFYIMIKSLIPNLFENNAIKGAGILLLSIYYLSIWLLLFAQFVDYYLDVWVVTNKRIINTEQHGLFSRIISENKIDKIQDITSEINGIIPTFLNYGNVHIQTAGATERIIFKQIKKPHRVRKIILALAKQEKYFGIIMDGDDKIITKKN